MAVVVLEEYRPAQQVTEADPERPRELKSGVEAPNSPAAALEPWELTEVGHIWQRTGVLAHVGVGCDESYMLIDKRHPHTEREIMVMSTGTLLPPGLHTTTPRLSPQPWER